jgi:hypothetical protein
MSDVYKCFLVSVFVLAAGLVTLVMVLDTVGEQRTRIDVFRILPRLVYMLLQTSLLVCYFFLFQTISFYFCHKLYIHINDTKEGDNMLTLVLIYWQFSKRLAPFNSP